MEGFDLAIWSQILLSCASEDDYVHTCYALVPKKWRSYFLRDPVAQVKRRRRYTYYVLHQNGDKGWWYRGVRHRECDLPALMLCNGVKEWYYFGKPHREGDLPAVEGPVVQAWYKNGLEHRDGGLPAVIHTKGWKYWYKNGLLHRDGGLPAMTYGKNIKEYWINGNKIK